MTAPSPVDTAEDARFSTDALDLTASKLAIFPLAFAVSAGSHQAALQAGWTVLQALQQALAGHHASHGKLVLCRFDEDIRADSGRFSFQREADGQVRLAVAVSVELVFDFQSPFWERMEALAATLDFLQPLCASLQPGVPIQLGPAQLPARKSA